MLFKDSTLAPLPMTEKSEFRPLPLLSNPHLQTFLGYYLPGPRLTSPPREHVVVLPDGDAIVLHDNSPLSWKEGQAIVLLIHGLSGSADSSQLHRLGYHLINRGVRVVRMDMRGAGKGLPLARGVYHAGRTDDIRHALATIHHWSPGSELIMVGLSLGGALVLRLAGLASQNPVPGLTRVAALGPPIDLEQCAGLLALPKNRYYEKFFVRDLLANARKRQEFFPDMPPLRLPKRMTIRLFDDLYTAPRSGFFDALDYYRTTTPLPLLSQIALPTLILTARDDPFIAVEPFETLSVPDNITIKIFNHGGHLGFLGWDGAGGYRWAERHVIDWIVGKASALDS